MPVEPGTLGYQALRYLEHLETKGYSPNTVGTAGIHLRFFLGWCEPRALQRPEEIDFAILERYQRGELVIWQYIGDPDAWRYLEYSKT